MAKYVYKPVEVEALKILEVRQGTFYDKSMGLPLEVVLENEERKPLSDAMIARYTPVVGDYYVIQPDGYEYINPKDVFERKFTKKLLPHQERVFAEKELLDMNIVKLSDFIGTEKYFSLSLGEQGRLAVQLDFMRGYSEVLKTRIENF